MALKDPVLIEARKLKKEKSIDLAIRYLADSASNYTVNNDIFFKYFLKCMDYMKEAPLSEYQKTIERNFNELFEVLNANNLYNKNYQDVCDSEFDYYIKKGDGNKAMESAGRISTLTCLPEFMSGYLLLIKDMSKKAWLATQLFNTTQRKKDSEYIFFYLKTNLLDIGWHLSIDLKHNMENYEMRHSKWFKNRFRQFEIFNNMRWNIEDEDELEDFVSDDTISVFKRYNPNASEIDLLFKLNDCFFNMFPLKIGFDIHYLEPEFNDLIEFGNHFSKIYENDIAYNVKIGIAANDVANEFIKSLS